MVAVTDDFNWGEGRGEDMALVRAFRKFGRKATRVSIQDDDFDWTSTKMVVIRSAWDKYQYYEDYQDFLQETDQRAILMNPLKIIQWQADKDVYMQQLKEAGINTPETILVGQADVEEDPANGDIEKIQEKLGCDEVIIKPASGNAGVGVRLYPEDGQLFLFEFRNMILNDEIALFQCYQEQIETKGERGIVFVGGQVSHGIMKEPAEDSYMVNTDFGGEWSVYDPTPEEVLFAKNVALKVHEIVGEMPAYLRVDVFNDNDDNLALMEIAAGTADLWMPHRPEAAELFAAFIDGYLRDREKECETESVSGKAAE